MGQKSKELPSAAQIPQEKAQSLLISKRELAAILDMSPTSVDRMRKAKQLGPKEIYIGGTFKWNRAEIIAWINNLDGNRHYDQEKWQLVKSMYIN